MELGKRGDSEYFGLFLIETLAEQLNGTFTLTTYEVTKYSFIFDVDEGNSEF